MSEIHEAIARIENALDHIRVKILSPDKTIRVKYSATGGVQLDCRPGSVRDHTEHSLSEQVEYALNGMVAGYREARPIGLSLVEREQRAEDESRVDQYEDQRGRLLDNRLSILTGKGRSSLGFVTVWLHATKGFRVDIASGCLRRLDQHLVESEINSALFAAFAEHNSKVPAIRREIKKLSPKELERALAS